MFPQSKNHMFGIHTGIGGSITNGNGRMNRHLTICLFRKPFHFILWTWKVGNGDDGSRSQ